MGGEGQAGHGYIRVYMSTFTLCVFTLCVCGVCNNNV